MMNQPLRNARGARLEGGFQRAPDTPGPYWPRGRGDYFGPMKAVLPPPTRLAVRFRLNEVGPLLSLAVLSVFGYGFVALADEVTEGETHAVDRALLLALRDPSNPANPLGPSWLEEAARDVTGLGGYTILTFLTVAAAGVPQDG